MEAVSTSTADAALGTERIGKLMLRFAIPSVVSIVVNSIYNMVDQIFIGQGVGYLGNAGTNIIMPMATVLMALTMMVGAGTATYISLNLGRGEPDRAARGACGAMTVTVVIGLVMTVLNNLIILYGAASEYGTDIPLAVLGIVVKINQLAAGVVLGIATGSQTILSYNYGRGQYGRVKSTFKAAVLVSFLVMLVVRILFWLFPEEIIGIFGQESELYVAFAVKCFNIFLLAIPLAGVCAVVSVLLQSIGRAAVAAFLSLTRQILYFVPAMLILAPLLGIDGILWGAAVSDTLAFVTAVILLAVFWKKIFREAKT